MHLKKAAIVRWVRRCRRLVSACESSRPYRLPEARHHADSTDSSWSTCPAYVFNLRGHRWARNRSAQRKHNKRLWPMVASKQTYGLNAGPNCDRGARLAMSTHGSQGKRLEGLRCTSKLPFIYRPLSLVVPRATTASTHSQLYGQHHEPGGPRHDSTTWAARGMVSW